MNQEQKIAKRNQIVSELISILQTYDCHYLGCYFNPEVQIGVVALCCDMVSRNVIRGMEEKGLKINHIYNSKYQSFYRISFRYDYD